MNIVTKLFGKLIRNEEGASAVEYAILASIIGAGLVSASTGLIGKIQTAFTTIGNSL